MSENVVKMENIKEGLLVVFLGQSRGDGGFQFHEFRVVGCNVRGGLGGSCRQGRQFAHALERVIDGG